MTDELKGTYLTARPQVAPETARAASVTVAENGRSREDVRDLLAVLGLIDAAPAGLLAPLPCGHPHGSLRRRLNGGRGTECVDCRRSTDRIDAARRRRTRVTAS